MNFDIGKTRLRQKGSELLRCIDRHAFTAFCPEFSLFRIGHFRGDHDFAALFQYAANLFQSAYRIRPEIYGFKGHRPACQMYRPDTADAWRRRIRCCTCPQIFLLLCGCMQRFLPNNQFHRRGFGENAPKYGQDFRLRRTRRPKHFLRLSADTPRTPKEREAHALCSLHSLPIYRICLPAFCNCSKIFLTYPAPLIIYTRTPAICRARRRNTAFPIRV